MEGRRSASVANHTTVTDPTVPRLGLKIPIHLNLPVTSIVFPGGLAQPCRIDFTVLGTTHPCNLPVITFAFYFNRRTFWSVSRLSLSPRETLERFLQAGCRSYRQSSRHYQSAEGVIDTCQL